MGLVLGGGNSELAGAQKNGDGNKEVKGAWTEKSGQAIRGMDHYLEQKITGRKVEKIKAVTIPRPRLLWGWPSRGYAFPKERGGRWVWGKN